MADVGAEKPVDQTNEENKLNKSPSPEKEAEKSENGVKSKDPEGDASPQSEESEKAKDDFKAITSGHQMDDLDINRDSRNRVKLYVLCEQRVWDDRGTGHVACVQLPGQQTFVIIVKLESAEKNVLESKILQDTVYQKQQETLIVWSESDTCDLALSFQEKTGCEEIWAKICEVQGRDPGDPDAGFDEMDDGDLSEGSTAGAAGTNGRIVLPPIEMGRLPEIDSVIANHMSTANLRDRMSTVMENDNTVPKLANLFNMCEDLENAEGLRNLYSIAKNTLLLNRSNIQDMIFEDSNMKSFIGMLEYDPAHETPRKHREFLYEKAHFKEVLPIVSDEVREKIHKVFRVQYIQDVCLPAPSLFEENLMGTMSSYLFFYRVEICTALQKDKRFMKDLFEQLKAAETPVMRRRELVSFIREFLNLSQSFPPNGCHQKEVIMKNLFGADIMSIIEPCVRSPDAVTRNTIVDLVSLLVEHNPQLVRDFLLKQAKDKNDDEVLLNRLLTHMLMDQDPELASANQVSTIMRTLLDPDNMVSMQKAERSEFLHLFYQRSIYTLVKPMFENVQGGHIKKDDYYTANNEALVVRLLCFCIEHHSFSMRQHCISSDLLNKVLVLLSSRHHFLALCSLKMLRTVLSVKDDFYNRYIIREKVMDRVVNCFLKNGPRYNLLNSALLETFEYIRTEDVKSLVKYLIETHQASFENVTYVKVFADLRTRYEQQRDRELAAKAGAAKDERATSPVTFAKEREEEQWFDGEDDSPASPVEVKKEIKKESESPRKSGAEPNFPSVLRRKNAIDDDESPVFSGQAAPLQAKEDKKIVIKMGDRSRTPSPSTSPSPSGTAREDEVSSSQNNSKENSPVSSPASSSGLKALVDYDCDSDESDEESGSVGPSNLFDALPSSSTGSPVPENGSQQSPPQHGSPTEDSVSSTSGGEAAADEKSPVQRRPKRPSSSDSPPDDTAKRVRRSDDGDNGEEDDSPKEPTAEEAS